jgi:hypothetical protein
MYPQLTQGQVEYVAGTIREFTGRHRPRVGRPPAFVAKGGEVA